MADEVAQNPGHPFFVLDVATVSADRQYAVLRMCEKCTFYKNAGMSTGQRCRRAGCDGMIREYHYFLSDVSSPTCPACRAWCQWDETLRVWTCVGCGDAWDTDDDPKFAAP